jgi:hypothetical protein
MRSPTRSLAVLSLTIALMTSIAACGSSANSKPTTSRSSATNTASTDTGPHLSASSGGASVRKGAPAEVVARVAGQTISKATLAHWIPIEAVLSHYTLPQEPVPSGVVPDPPSYTACIAYLRATPPEALNAQAMPTTAQLKERCRAYDKAIRRHTLQILVSYAWTRAEAHAHGIDVTDREVQRRWVQLEPERFPTEAIFTRYLRYTGSTVGDQLFHLRFNLLSERLGHKLLAEGGLPRAKKFYSEFARRWAAKTDCSPGYVIPECKQYKGPEAPEASI